MTDDDAMPRRGMTGLLVTTGLLAVLVVAAPAYAAAAGGPVVPFGLTFAGMLATVVLVFLVPLCALPLASERTARVTRGLLVARTTRGRREVSLAALDRVRGFGVAGRGVAANVLWLRDAQGRLVLLTWVSPRRRCPAAVVSAVRSLEARRPGRVSHGARGLLWIRPGRFMGLAGAGGTLVQVVLLVVALAVTAPLYLALVTALAGSPQ